MRRTILDILKYEKYGQYVTIWIIYVRQESRVGIVWPSS